MKKVLKSILSELGEEDGHRQIIYTPHVWVEHDWIHDWLFTCVPHKVNWGFHLVRK